MQGRETLGKRRDRKFGVGEGMFFGGYSFEEIIYLLYIFLPWPFSFLAHAVSKRVCFISVQDIFPVLFLPFFHLDFLFWDG